LVLFFVIDDVILLSNAVNVFGLSNFIKCFIWLKNCSILFSLGWYGQVYTKKLPLSLIICFVLSLLWICPLSNTINLPFTLLQIFCRNSLNLSAFTEPFWYNSDDIHFLLFIATTNEYFLKTSLLVVFLTHLSPKYALQYLCVNTYDGLTFSTSSFVLEVVKDEIWKHAGRSCLSIQHFVIFIMLITELASLVLNTVCLTWGLTHPEHTPFAFGE